VVQASLLAPDQGTEPALEVTSESLGAHILSEIARCTGPQLPFYETDQVLAGFWERFGPAGMLICDRAFNAHQGYWNGAPITIQRFQAHHDHFFAIPLLEEAQAVNVSQ
jgi:hypothetical protein